MRETRADNMQGWTLALLLHGFLFALMFIGLWWQRTPPQVSAAGSPVTVLVVPTNEELAMARETKATVGA